MRIGWIGLGRMGKPMVMNLITKGFHVTVQNRSQEKVAELVKTGAVAGISFDQMGSELDFIHTCLPDSETVVDVINGKNGVLKNPKPGLIIVDHSTIHPEIAKSLYDESLKKQVSFLDAPVSGSGPFAEKGELTIMCGGELRAFNKASSALSAMGKTVELVGPSGSGSLTKVVNNMLMATNLAVAMEALIFAAKSGLDLQSLFSVIRTASGASRTWERNIPRILSRQFGKDGSAWLTTKDQDLAFSLASEMGFKLSVFESSRLFWHSVLDAGLGEEDPSHAFTALEAKLGFNLNNSSNP
ncbi:MAG: NAD(P)-dependent oxidoreductase [Dehalococcoidia bacterium]|nr:NAD(P)-dependent oxidoreductase [Dehalococcoidia bacterium]